MRWTTFCDRNSWTNYKSSSRKSIDDLIGQLIDKDKQVIKYSFPFKVIRPEVAKHRKLPFKKCLKRKT